MGKEIILKPLSSKPWADVIRYKNCHEDISTYYLKNGSRYTGLTKADEKRLGEEIRQDLNPNSSFWDTFFIRMASDEIKLDIDDPYDEVKYLFLKNHRMVKTSLNEPKATAEYVLINHDEEAKKENTRAKTKRKAFKEFDKLSATDVRKALRLYGFKSDNIGSEQAEQKLFELVEEKPSRFLELWVDNKDKHTHFLIEEAISKNVLRKNKNAFMYGTEIIGHTLDDTIAYLNDKKNQELKEIIMNEIESK